LKIEFEGKETTTFETRKARKIDKNELMTKKNQIRH